MFIDFISSFAAKARATKGLRRILAAFAFGAITAIAYAPINFFPILWFSFPAFIFLLQGSQNARQAFGIGWAFACGCFTFSFYWIAASMFVDIAQFWWAVPLAVFGLPIFFGFYYGIAMAIFQRFHARGLSSVLLFALMWFLADYARGHIFGGFPWNLEGYVWNKFLPMLQSVSVIGIYGLTFVTLIAISLPVLLAEKSQRNIRIVLGSVVVLAVIATAGALRMASTAMPMADNVRLRLVQPNTDQAKKWAIDDMEPNFQHILSLTAAPGEKKVTHIIWPETAATFYLTEDDMHRKAIAAQLQPGSLVLTGVVRRATDERQHLHYYNSLIAVDAQARVLAAYDKFHLVPFGEYMPGRRFIPLRTLANLGLDFTAGAGVRSLRVPNLPPFSPLICYEAIFSGEVVDESDRPTFMLNVTNDGWYGKTAGPYQHFSIVTARAVEEGLPLVRAANSGISGVVDGYGRMIAELGLGETGFVDSDLPQALPPTFFSRYGEWSLWGIFLLCAGGAYFARRQPSTDSFR